VHKTAIGVGDIETAYVGDNYVRLNVYKTGYLRGEIGRAKGFTLEDISITP
jgi:hypothetical protein